VFGDKPKRAWIVFAVQALVVAVIWSAFLGLAVKHPVDGGFVLQVAVLSLVLPAAVLLNSRRRRRRP
jgi:hypothetical protein